MGESEKRPEPDPPTAEPSADLSADAQADAPPGRTEAGQAPPPVTEEGRGELPAEEEARKIDEMLADLKKKAKERDEYLDLLKRARADFANYQKRIEEERQRWEAMAQRDLLAGLLVASDQCMLAARKAREDESTDSLRDAMCLVWSEVERFLKNAGASVIPTVGRKFDPESHEAVSVTTRPDVPDSTVVAELKPGYSFRGSVLRPAQVVVSKRPSPAEEETSPERPKDEAGAEPSSGGGGEPAAGE
jgi:molecular chaperone GrpE